MRLKIGILLLTTNAIAHYYTTAENIFSLESNRKKIYREEHLPVIEVNNSFKLGKLVALRFIEWVEQNPTGVISLPTGKTPEYFIKYLDHYKKNWTLPAVQKELKFYGITSPRFPDTSRLTFVQMDEFFPMRSSQKNSFNFYVQNYYLPLLQLRPENILLIDTKPDENIEEYCAAYEEKIRARGGIGFFLGGIGPDGHIAFNMRGSEHSSTTRLITLNYESAAAAATDLGGIEFSRNKKAITIGLGTITAKKDATIIIMAAGEAKAPIVAQSIESGDIQLPATALHNHSGARFYLTSDAASHLRGRKKEDIAAHASEEQLYEIVIDLALAHKKMITELSRQNFEQSELGQLLLKKIPFSLEDFLIHTRDTLVATIERSLEVLHDINILHTEPHHDDIMLSYHPVATALLPHNNNFFVTLTSGFNAVTNGYLKKLLDGIDAAFLDQHRTKIFEQSYEQVLLNTKQDPSSAQGEQFIFLHALRSVFSLTDAEQLLTKISWLNTYLERQQPGEKDCSEVQLLKGIMRESEIDRLWTLYDVPHERVHHLRSHFYNGDYFNPTPTISKDVLPIVELLKKTNPQLVTLAFDPPGTGPDTHYKVLQLVAEALRLEKNNNSPIVWGYRNVWHRFKIPDATRIMPVSAEELERLHGDFMSCFSTQKTASFPAHQFDGPFSGLSCKILEEQFQMLQQLLGKNYFAKHANEKMRTARGMLFLKEMSVEEFLSQAMELKSHVDFS